MKHTFVVCISTLYILLSSLVAFIISLLGSLRYMYKPIIIIAFSISFAQYSGKHVTGQVVQIWTSEIQKKNDGL